MPLIIPLTIVEDDTLHTYRFALLGSVNVTRKMEPGSVHTSVNVQGGEAVPLIIDVVSEDLR